SLLRAFRPKTTVHAQSDARIPNPESRIPSADGAFLSLPGGLSDLTHALVAELGEANVRTATSVEAITGRGPFTIRTAGGDAVEARAVVLATPAFATAALLRDRDTAIAARCAEIPYASAATVALAFRRDAVAHPLNGSGFVVPRVERTGLLAAS